MSIYSIFRQEGLGAPVKQESKKTAYPAHQPDPVQKALGEWCHGQQKETKSGEIIR